MSITPIARAVSITYGMWFSQIVHVLASLGVPDALGDGAEDAASLAPRVGANADRLRRLMRAAAFIGLLEVRDKDRFALTEVGRCFRQDVPGSVYPWAVAVGMPWYWQSYGQLLHAVRTGEDPFVHVFERPLFDYLGDTPMAGDTFDAAMQCGLQNQLEALTAALVQAWPLSDRCLVDVAGGTGSLVGELLRSVPTLRGVLFDRPPVVPAATQRLSNMGVLARCQVVGGSFFDRVPSGGDYYLMRTILHDWDDTDAIRVLTNCRAAMSDTARLGLVEMLVDPNKVGETDVADLQVMVLLNGRERTTTEYAGLFHKAGLSLTRTVSLVPPFHLIEATAL